MITITPTALPEVLEITPRRFADSRGFFTETWNRARLAEHGIALDFVQDNHSTSLLPNTIRALHFQAPPFAQDKLVRVTRGRILDVAVDIRLGSPNFGKSVAVELSAATGNQLLVPKGFLHGFRTLEPDTDVSYKVTAPYAPDADGGVRFDDPDLAVDWGIDPSEAILSDKDAAAGSFADLDNPFTYEP